MSDHPEIRVTLQLECFIECPNCKETIRRRATLGEESLVTGNTTQKACYAMSALKQRVGDLASYRLWNREMCGKCQIAKSESEEP